MLNWKYLSNKDQQLFRNFLVQTTNKVLANVSKELELSEEHRNPNPIYEKIESEIELFYHGFYEGVWDEKVLYQDVMINPRSWGLDEWIISQEK